MSDDAWLEAFGRIVRGQSSLREEAERLGVNHTTVMRRFQAWTEGEVERARSEFAQLHEATQRVRGELDDLKREYDRKKAEAEAKLRSDMGKMDEEFRRATVKAEGEHKKRMSSMDAELSAKEDLLSEFKKVGLEPTKGLQLLKRDSNLDASIAQKSEQLTVIEKKAARLEKRVKLSNEQLAGWGHRLRAVQADVAREEAKLTHYIQTGQLKLSRTYAQLTCVSSELDGKRRELEVVKAELGATNELKARAAQDLRTLENEVASLKKTRDELADVIRKLRGRRAKLEFITAQVVPNVVAVGGR